MAEPKRPPTAEQVTRILDAAWDEYHGDVSVFASAAGALWIGRKIGWHGVRITMSGTTFRKYETILGIKWREVLPARCDETGRIRGIRIADGIGKFWQAITSGLVSATEAKQVEVGRA